MSFLVPLLSDPDTSVAATAAFGLGLIGDTAATPALEPLVGTSVAPTLAGEAASALGKLRTESARAALRSLLESAPIDDSNRWVIGQALLAIWKYPRPDDPKPLVRWTRSDDPHVRWRATYALVRRPDPSVTRVLMELAGDTDPAVRAIAIRGLTAPLADTAGIAASAIVPILLAALEDEEYRVRVNAVRSLGSFSVNASVDALRRILASRDVHLALSAAESLGRLGTAAEAAAPALRDLAMDAGRPIALRAAALVALSEVEPEGSGATALRLAEAPEWRIRAAAARVFARGGQRAGPELAARVRDRDPRVSAAALAAAVEAAGDSIQPLRGLLLEALGTPDVIVRTAALTGLEKLADPATLPVVLDAYGRALADTLNDAALAAVSTLAALQDAGAPAARAFSLRFERPDDYLLRRRIAERLGAQDSATREPLPIETGLEPADYRSIAEEWVVPAVMGAEAPRVRIETDAGMIDLELQPAVAPLTVANFVHLMERGYFDGQQWPRVVPNFVVQGGDPRGDMAGGPGWAIRDEINRSRYLEGSVGMALAGPDTGGSQFFITHSPQPHLDGSYTIFGRVVAGLDVTRRVLPGDTIYRVSRLR